ncbi:RNA-directed DNA polymerase, eukaryota, Reverse transcriptase zinc-binding domain protein [Artemisia annua]|uniref:RNA-directed DNA polymerase, eukaryota, Reverse transcriptase zinc-binding domain protein n=1 Tax=Artemisia annua TaxID=35608 RepID=A0A2U1NPZ6_ARTAN|nr:RNA-directed DNA polymerase, eukaryota, Reverse transcriptase zinc-binding domain protein [Artemisia annua]
MDSLWVKWIHTYRLRGRSFWDVPCRGNMSWSWRKILQIRPLVRQFFWYNIGNGLKASAWFDKWCSVGPLSLIVSLRDIHRAGFSSTSLVRDIIVEDAWAWPNMFLHDRYWFSLVAYLIIHTLLCTWRWLVYALKSISLIVVIIMGCDVKSWKWVRERVSDVCRGGLGCDLTLWFDLGFIIPRLVLICVTTAVGTSLLAAVHRIAGS